MMNFLFDLRTAVVFLVMISILVAAHEYGHYIFARFFGMGVEEFAIGMGKKLKIWKRKTHDIPVGRDYVHDTGELSKGALFEGGNRTSTSALVDTPTGKVLRETTEFTIRMLPIGGFVRIKGMIPQEDGSEVNVPGGFYSKPPWQRLIVLLAGPAASVLSGILVLIALFWIRGTEKPINLPILQEVSANSRASKAGLLAGDRIVAVNDWPISTFYELVQSINQSPEKPLKLQYVRGNRGGSVTVTPESTDGPTYGPDLEIGPEHIKHGFIGVRPKIHLVPLSLAGATEEAIRYPIEAIQGLFRLVKQPSSIKDEAGGAITMVVVTHAATQEGIAQVILVACLLSISVGIFNLLPIPPLDGGQMLMAFAELLRGGRRLSIQVQQWMMNAGAFIVILLAMVVLFIDVQRFTGGDSKAPKPVDVPAKK